MVAKEVSLKNNRQITQYNVLKFKIFRPRNNLK